MPWPFSPFSLCSTGKHSKRQVYKKHWQSPHAPSPFKHTRLIYIQRENQNTMQLFYVNSSLENAVEIDIIPWFNWSCTLHLTQLWKRCWNSWSFSPCGQTWDKEIRHLSYVAGPRSGDNLVHTLLGGLSGPQNDATFWKKWKPNTEMIKCHYQNLQKRPNPPLKRNR